MVEVPVSTLPGSFLINQLKFRYLKCALLLPDVIESDFEFQKSQTRIYLSIFTCQWIMIYALRGRIDHVCAWIGHHVHLWIPCGQQLAQLNRDLPYTQITF